MSIYEYGIIDEKYCVINNSNHNLKVYSVSNSDHPVVKRYKCFLGHREDLIYSEQYLDQMFFDRNTSLIDGALINSSIQLLVKCFTNGTGGGRSQMNEEKVFCSYSESIGIPDCLQIYKKFYRFRNTSIVHDQGEYLDTRVGITVNEKTSVAEDITYIVVRGMFLYKEYKEQLKQLLYVARRFVNDQLKEIESLLLTLYNQGAFEEYKEEMKCDGIRLSDCW